MAEFYIPVGERDGVTLLESDTTRFARCTQNAERAMQDAYYRDLSERNAHEARKKLLAVCAAKSSPLSREIYAQSKGGMKQKAIAEAHGLPLWRVRQMIGRERVLEAK